MSINIYGSSVTRLFRGPYKRTQTAYLGGAAVDKAPRQTREKKSLVDCGSSTAAPQQTSVPKQTRLSTSAPSPLVYSGTLYIAAAVDEPCLLWLVYCGHSSYIYCHRRRAAAAPQLAVVGKIQLAEAPQFESFYTVPLFRGILAV